MQLGFIKIPMLHKISTIKFSSLRNKCTNPSTFLDARTSLEMETLPDSSQIFLSVHLSDNIKYPCNYKNSSVWRVIRSDQYMIK